MVISMYIFVSMTDVLFLWLILLSYPAPLVFALVLVVLLSHPGPLGACIADAATPLSSLIWCWLVLLVLAS